MNGFSAVLGDTPCTAATTRTLPLATARACDVRLCQAIDRPAQRPRLDDGYTADNAEFAVGGYIELGAEFREVHLL
jgi:hypothetical protein